ncbi:hypothetical protein Phum_PHUM029170 [Pediculus humanus corporis]|uniref:Uncharacterized protein n=1 Tax=Pediculus humanus subsp. corporis TaxID=121224 RepID=E0VA77_PEDHC|nr:uncharacterized protein Phum_PHUM029170 [Pediculus humanus corporis]EEB10283.1 hypothetical protein Phum_PHUM029170 [Pediculus humanus corporis]
MADDSGENQNCLNLSHEEKDIIIRQLSQEVESLKQINKELSSERDNLLCEQKFYFVLLLKTKTNERQSKKTQKFCS